MPFNQFYLCKYLEVSLFAKLPQNVYYIKGKIKACLYDMRLENVYIYWIGELEKKLLSDLLDNNLEVNKIIEKDHRLIVEHLSKIGLLEFSKISYVPNNLLSDAQKAVNPCVEFAWIEITNKCNQGCVHCYEKSNIEGHFMSEEFFDIVLKNLVQKKIKKVQFIGGEPLLSGNKLYKYVDLLNRSGILDIEIFTNGTLIDIMWINFFKQHKLKIALSVYSKSPVTHDQITKVHGSFKKLKMAIELLNQNKIYYRAALIRTKFNEYDELNEIKTAYGLKTDKIGDDIVRITGRATNELLTPSLIKKRSVEMDSFNHVFKRNKIYSNALVHNCFSKTIYISHKLDVFPCVMERSLSYGNLNNNSLDNILKLNQNICSLNKDRINECNMCEFRYACFDCRSNRLENNFFCKPWYCKYSPEKGEWNV